MDPRSCNRLPYMVSDQVRLWKIIFGCKYQNGKGSSILEQ